MSPILLPPVEQGLASGDPLIALEGTGTSAPQGLEALLEYNGIYLHDRSTIDKIRIVDLDGFQDADIRDTREVNPQDHGETPFDAFYGGRTLTIAGRIEAHNVKKLRDMQQALRTAFLDLEEKPLIIRTGSLDTDVYINCKKVSALQGRESQSNFVFYRDFLLTLRASNPRFLSYREITTDRAFGKIDSFDAEDAVMMRNEIRQPTGFSTPVLDWSSSTVNGAATALTTSSSLLFTFPGEAEANVFVVTTTTTNPADSIRVAVGEADVAGRANVTALRPVAFRVAIKATQTAGTIDSYDFYARFYDGAGATISDVLVENATTPAITQRELSGVVTAPAGAVRASMHVLVRTPTAGAYELRLNGAMVVNDINYVPHFFYGSNYRARFSGTPHSSTSELLTGDVIHKPVLRTNYAPNPNAEASVNNGVWPATSFSSGGVAGAANTRTRLTNELTPSRGTTAWEYTINAHTGGTSRGAWVYGDTPTSLITLKPVRGGEFVFGHVSAKLMQALPVGCDTWVSISFYDKNGTFISVLSPTNANYRHINPNVNSWYSMFGAVQAPANARYASVRMGMGGDPVSLDSGATYLVRVANWMLTEASGIDDVVDYFDGNSDNAEFLSDIMTTLTARSELYDPEVSAPWRYSISGTQKYKRLSVAGGTLRQNAVGTSMMLRNDMGYSPTDAKASMRYSIGQDVGTAQIVILKWRDINNYVYGSIAGTNLQIVVISGGVATSVSSVTAARATNTNYWLQVGSSGNQLFAYHWLTDPLLGGSPATTAIMNLSGALATAFGSGVPGDVGLALSGNDVTVQVDGFAVQPTSIDTSVFSLNNQGNFKAQPVVRFYGPMTDIILTNETTGDQIVISGTIPANDYYELDVAKKTLKDSAGNNRYSQLSILSTDFTIQPTTEGANDISFFAVSTSGITPAIRVYHQDTWM